jgi:hypothetical protein
MNCQEIIIIIARLVADGAVPLHCIPIFPQSDPALVHRKGSTLYRNLVLVKHPQAGKKPMKSNVVSQVQLCLGTTLGIYATAYALSARCAPCSVF